MDKVEVKVNVINQLKLLRRSTFKDMLCFLDENVQNAQRAKATEVRISVNRNDNIVVIENNGEILTKPQALFAIAESGWDEQIKSSENPFGMGFFSNITVSDFIEIHTGHKKIIFDVRQMIESNNTEISVEEIEEFYDGFKLILNNFDFETVHSMNIKERVRILGAYVHELDIYLDGKLQEKKDLISSHNDDYEFVINEVSVKGCIAIAENYSYGDNLSVFYKGRYVSKLSNMPYLKGDLHISDEALNLTSPDRKDIIKDSKFIDFRNFIKNSAEDFCNKLLLSGEDKLDNYSCCIGWYANETKIKNKIKFMTFKSNNEQDFKYLKGIAIARKKSEEINTFKDYELFLKRGSGKQQEENFEEIEIVPKLETCPKEACGRVKYDSNSSFSEGYIKAPEINEKELIEKRGEIIFGNKEPVFYIRFDEVEKYEYKLNVAKHYKLKIIVSRNKIESSILQNMKDSDNVFHISDLKEDIKITGSLYNTTLSTKERRAMMIFNMISEILGFSYNIFSIGDLMVTKNVKVESIDVDETIIDDDIVVLKDSDNKKIYVDRTVIKKNNLREDEDVYLDINDYKFIMTNFKEISKQISKLNFMNREDCEGRLLAALGQAA